VEHCQAGFKIFKRDQRQRIVLQKGWKW